MSNENPILSSSPSDEIRPNRADRVFKRRFIATVCVKRSKNELTRDEAERYMLGIDDPYVLRRLRCQCEFVAGDIARGDSWIQVLFTWLMDNWPTVLQILLGLLVFLDDAADSEV